MAPKRKPTSADNSVAAAAAAASTRVTRSSTRRANSTAAPPAADPAPPKRKKAKATTTKAEAPPSPTEEEAAAEKKVLDGSKTIVIEHCKQCNSFKTRAIQVKNELEKSVVGVTVVVNPEKPRRGCFEIREEGGEVFVSLLDMKRPFPPLKALDMEKLISDIIEKI